MKEDSFFQAVRSLRRKVAREAALLLYTSQEKEYRQAKERAARNLGTRVLPTNEEVAEELDVIAEELEGQSRQERLIRMRREALEIMDALELLYPKLVGSVWRGTVHRSSDIDVTVFSSDPNQVVGMLEQRGFFIKETELVSAEKRGEKGVSLHVFVILPSGDEAEIVVRPLEDLNQEARCEIYGDAAKGLDFDHLKKVLAENPLKRFVPGATF